MLKTTLGQLLVNDVLPDDLQDHERVLDKKGVKALLQQVAERHPEKYREIAQRLSDVGREAAYNTGGHSFGLQHLKQSLAGRKMRIELGQELQNIYRSRLSSEDKQKAIIATTGRYQGKLSDDVLAEATATDNPLSRQLRGAGRGNKFGLNSLLGGDLLYTDHKGNVVPIPVLRSYSQGLHPHEYFAGSFGARKGVIDVKMATQDAGFFAKQLVQAAHRLLVEDVDDADDAYDEASPRGLVVNTDDADNEGALLAHPVAGYKRNTELTPRILKDLREQGHDEILVRSPTVGGPPGGGVYARDVGRRERGALSPVGDFVGIAAAQALAEPVTQAQISSKHTGGIAGAAGAGAISGFKYINQLVQVPKTFRSGAAHAQTDGRVQRIEKAPQGGQYVWIDNEKHYVGQDYPLLVKTGDEIEAGDVLSEGIPNPSEIVKHKGLGEGRRYFIDAFRKSFESSGVSGHRRNMELIARGLINHVRLTDEVGDWSPDDVVPYQTLERQWRPRPGHGVVAPQAAVGQYLERPVLHYTVGTKVRPSMLKTMQKFGVQSVVAHRDPPPFEAEMIRGMANVAHDPDWMTRMLGSYQSKSLLEGARRGAVSDEAGSSYVPALASGASFGRQGLTQGWDSTPAVPPSPATPETEPRTRSIVLP
jgi:DNA-directed RNA polymerase subunit beta'